MSLLPTSLFVNLYPKSIGPCVGAAFETQADADRCANSHRIACVELGVHAAAPAAAPAPTGLFVDPRPEVMAAIEAYARENSISPKTAVDEALRAYFMEPHAR